MSEDRRVQKSHKAVAILLVAVGMTLLVANTAHADAADAAEDWSVWVCYYLGYC